MACTQSEPQRDRALQAGADALLARSGVYAFLAHGFSPPDEEVVRFLRGPGADGTAAEPGVGGPLEAAMEAARDAGVQDLARASMRLFDPAGGPFPYETEYLKTGEFSKAQVLADVMGFYRAFGVEPRSDRADHVAAELEFMHLVTLKEAHALRRGQQENARLCRDAARKFFREHLATWADALVSALREGGRADAHPFYAHLVDLLEQHVRTEQGTLS